MVIFGFLHLEDAQSADPSAFLWPTQPDCPKCWPSLPSNNGLLQIQSTDRDKLYNHLKKPYWQGGVHSNRLLVLNKLSQAKRALSLKWIQVRFTAHYWSTPLLILNLFLACYLIRVFLPRGSSTMLILLCNTFRHGRRIKHSGKHLKTQADQSNFNDQYVHLDQSNQRMQTHDLPSCTTSSES